MFKKFLEDDSRKNELVKQTYHLIHKRRTVTKADLIEHIQSKPTTMTRVIEELLQNGWIKEGGVGPSNGGRPPILYEVSETSAWIIGIDISRTTTRIVLTTINFTIVESEIIQMTRSHTPDIVFEELNRIIWKWLKRYAISFDQLLGIGVGAVGPILRHERKIMKPESFLSLGWENVKVPAYFSDFPVAVMLDNGANTAAMAELFACGEVHKNILYCINGFGIRGGFVNDGKIFYSGLGDTSALGHMIVQADGKVCKCGRQGCLAAYSTITSMVDEFERISGEKNMTYHHFLHLMQAKDERALHIANKAAFYFGVGLANMINSLRPELVVLHGPIIYETSSFFEDAVRSAQSHIFMPDILSPIYKKGSLKEDAIALGGAIQIFQSYFNGV